MLRRADGERARRILVDDERRRAGRRRRACCGRSRPRLPDLRLLADPADRESYRRDETAYLAAGLPLAVALPTATAEVVELVRLCGEHDVPIVPRGAGSGLSGGAAGIEGALTIAFTRMARILEIDRENLTVTTQPGHRQRRPEEGRRGARACSTRRTPPSYEMCTIGGNLGTNAGGLCCVKYGVTRDAVLGLEVVMADATVLRLGGKNVKDVAGYGLIPLLVGSQGTLGLMTEATLRLRPAPPPRATMLAFFPSLESAGEAVAGLTAAGLGPVTLELMDRFTIRAVDDVHRLGLDRDAAAMLLIESDLPGGAAAAEIDAAVPVARPPGRRSSIRAADPQEADWLRQGRRLAFRALEHLGVARMEDVGVPRSRVPEMLAAIEAIARTPPARGRDVRACRRRQPPPDVRAGPGRGRVGGRPQARGGARATCTRPPSRSAGRSRASTGSASRGGTGSCGSAARTRSP